MNEHAVRPTAVAGRFYPSDAAELGELVDSCLEVARRHRADRAPVPKAVIAPHAGFIFSGPIAGTAFSTFEGTSAERVVLIGPSHYVGFEGVATSGYGAFSTPLGEIPVDGAAVAKALEFEFVREYEHPHEREHSLETHLPFLQRVLGDFTIVPLVTGRVDRRQLAELLDALWGGPETLISVSSDLSHFFDASTARALDEQTAAAIERFDAAKVEPSAQGACGAVAIRGLLETAKRRQMRVTTLDLRNSSDTAGGPDRVVGYGAFAFWE